jgi:hypothetical protein
MHGRAAGHRRRGGAPATGAVLRDRDAEPHRARRDVSAAGGPAGPIPGPDVAGLSQHPERSAHPSRATHTRAARRPGAGAGPSP